MRMRIVFYFISLDGLNEDKYNLKRVGIFRLFYFHSSVYTRCRVKRLLRDKKFFVKKLKKKKKKTIINRDQRVFPRKGIRCKRRSHCTMRFSYNNRGRDCVEFKPGSV